MFQWFLTICHSTTNTIFETYVFEPEITFSNPKTMDQPLPIPLPVASVIDRPTFLIDKSQVIRNIQQMAARAQRHKLHFRPHFKTHQSAEIGNWFRDFGVTSITVSSVSMAVYFASNGWDDITIAFPLNIREIATINELSGRIRINVLVDNSAVAEMLGEKAVGEIGVFIEVDTGHLRSGIEVQRVQQVDQVLDVLRRYKQLVFRGFLSHSGQTYAARSANDVLLRHSDALMKMRALRDQYASVWPGIIASIGDTPACSMAENFDGVDELRPGNFVFYDLMQEQLGACSRSEVAGRLLCPVVSRHLTRNQVVLYGGAVHMSKEFLITGRAKKSFGTIEFCDVETGSLADDTTFVGALSQEHGIVKATFDDTRKFRIGGLTSVLPVHSCLTADLAPYFLTTTGQRIEKMPR